MFVALLLGRPLPLPTAAETFARTQKAYDAVRTFEQDATGTIDSAIEVAEPDAAGTIDRSRGTAHISFSRPGRLRVTGKTLFDSPYDLLSHSGGTWVANPDEWQKVDSAEFGIAAITGISGGAGTLVPGALVHATWGALSVSDPKKAKIERLTLDGRTVLKVQNATSNPTTTWIDEKTGFVVKTRTVLGEYVGTVVFSAPKVNGKIPEARFQK